MSRVFLVAIALVVFASIMSAVSGFGSNEDKFIKRYAMMKIYESCFGPEVAKQVRKEMKAACAKCAAYDQPQQPQALPRPPPPPQGGYDNREPQIPAQIADPENTMYANQQTIDAEKLQQAILSYRPLNNPFAAAPNQYRPYQQVQQPNYFTGYPQAPVAVPYVYPGYQGFQGYQSQAFPTQSYSSFPYFGPQLYSNNRVSRDMDIRNQIESITSRTSKLRNVTCVMQELGYLDENLEPNFEKISDRIGNLPVSDELKRDMQDGVVFCQQFSQCIPDVKKDRSPLSRELIRPMFFFKCYKHKKLEACIMKDVREKFAGVADDDFDGEGVEFRRTSRAAKNSQDDLDKMADSVYDFLYGGEQTIDIDSVL